MVILQAFSMFVDLAGLASGQKISENNFGLNLSEKTKQKAKRT